MSKKTFWYRQDSGFLTLMYKDNPLCSYGKEAVGIKLRRDLTIDGQLAVIDSFLGERSITQIDDYFALPFIPHNIYLIWTATEYYAVTPCGLIELKIEELKEIPASYMTASAFSSRSGGRFSES